MNAPFSASREFIRGCASRAELICILSKGKALMEQDISHTSIIGNYQGRWTRTFDAPWNSSAISLARAPSSKFVIVGEDGQVAAYGGPDNIVSERLSPAPTLIRNAASINGYVYACGMKRQVYERAGEAQWIDISAPFPAEGEIAGFEAMHGYARDEIYAAGWSGEIWEFDGSRWTDRSGITSVILSCVFCAPDGMVYVGGQRGTLIAGRHAAWGVMQLDDEIDDDIWDVHWFMDRLYVATIRTLYMLQGRSLVPVRFGTSGAPSCFNLSSAEGTLWSVGHADIASFDGTAWRRYP